MTNLKEYPELDRELVWRDVIAFMRKAFENMATNDYMKDGFYYKLLSDKMPEIAVAAEYIAPKSIDMLDFTTKTINNLLPSSTEYRYLRNIRPTFLVRKFSMKDTLRAPGYAFAKEPKS